MPMVALQKIKKHMFPLTLSRGLEIVQALTNPETKTDKWYENSLNSFMKEFDDMLVKDVTGEMVRTWSKSLDEHITLYGGPYSEWTKNSLRRAVRAYFNKLIEVGHLDPPGPVARFVIPSPPKGLPKHLTDQEVARLRHYAKHSVPNSAREHAMMELLYATGCRKSDLLSMRVSNLQIEKIDNPDLSTDEKELIDLAASMELIHLIDADHLHRYRGKVLVIGKGSNQRKKTRYAYFGDTAARALMAYLDERPHNAPDNLWLTNDGMPLQKTSLYHAFKKVARKAGVDASPHDLRHTFAFRLIKNGADAKVVQELLGHSDLATTMNVYYNLSDLELWQAYDRFG